VFTCMFYALCFNVLHALARKIALILPRIGCLSGLQNTIITITNESRPASAPDHKAAILVGDRVEERVSLVPHNYFLAVVGAATTTTAPTTTKETARSAGWLDAQWPPPRPRKQRRSLFGRASVAPRGARVAKPQRRQNTGPPRPAENSARRTRGRGLGRGLPWPRCRRGATATRGWLGCRPPAHAFDGEQSNGEPK